jgi:hypothetical protein
MKLCPTCQSKYPDDANFCPQESCATPNGPQRLSPIPEGPRGRFQLGERLGGRSTGEVYRATDTQTGAQVAYKTVHREVLSNPAALSRAEREFKQLLRVPSPRIATIIECGKTANDQLFVAMELCEGTSLESLLRSGPVPLERAKALVAQIGQALLEAQKAGIVHRDVAPKNVLVAPSGDIKLINFPLARPINDKAAGVPAYLSPEQVQGKPVDQRSNTYSLAALLYHLLTGEPPFQGTPETVLELHLTSPPLAPSQRRPEANLTPEVDRVILKALDKSSSRRHLTLRLFLSEVEALSAPAVPSAPAAGGTKDASVGFAKTMLFAGGQAEVANLVAKAIAARAGGAAGAGAGANTPAPTLASGPASHPGAPQATPAPVVAAPPKAAPANPGAGHTTPPAYVIAPAPVVTANLATPPPHVQVATAATMAIPGPASTPMPSPGAPAPASNGASADRELPDHFPRLTPPPVTPYPPSGGARMTAAQAGARPAAQAEPAKGAAGGQGAAFRETLWFKKGDVEHMIAEAKAKMTGHTATGESELPSDEHKPIEDRYVDDGSVTAEDRKKFSLRTGGTATAMPAMGGVVPGDSMSERDVLREVSGSRKNVVLIVAAVIVLAAVAVVAVLMRSKPASPPPPSAPVAAPVPAPPPEPAAAVPPPEPAAVPPQANAEAKAAAVPATADKKPVRRKTAADKKKKR